MVYRRYMDLVFYQIELMAITAQISKEKQSIITLRHEGQSTLKMSRTLNVSSNVVAKTIKRYDETGSHNDQHRTGSPRVISTADDKFIRVTSFRNYSPNKCFKVQVTDTSQHQLFRGDCMNQAFMVKFLQRNHYYRTPIRRTD